MAVALLRTAGLKNDGKQVEASQDRDPVDRAARNFCYGLKRLFKEEWEVPYNVNISEAAPLYILTVGGELALTAHVSQHAVDYKRHGGWATWKELRDSQGGKDLLQKSEDLIIRTSKGSKGTMKGTSKGRTAHRDSGTWVWAMALFHTQLMLSIFHAAFTDPAIAVVNHLGSLQHTSSNFVVAAWNIEGLTRAKIEELQVHMINRRVEILCFQ